MSQPPAAPKIYHITHVDYLDGILRDGVIFPDSVMAANGGRASSIGMTTIKDRRLRLPVSCHPGTCVGEYVPFNFCPRSVMLYVIARANHPELAYRGGQGPIVHLEADLAESVAWADRVGRRWAFTTANAGAGYVDFFSDYGRLDAVDWEAVASDDFRSAQVKEAKQSEFLMGESFPWELVRRIGVRSNDMHARVEAALAGAGHKPVVEVRPLWYF